MSDGMQSDGYFSGEQEAIETINRATLSVMLSAKAFGWNRTPARPRDLLFMSLAEALERISQLELAVKELTERSK